MPSEWIRNFFYDKIVIIIISFWRLFWSLPMTLWLISIPFLSPQIFFPNHSQSIQPKNNAKSVTYHYLFAHSHSTNGKTVRKLIWCQSSNCLSLALNAIQMFKRLIGWKEEQNRLNVAKWTTRRRIFLFCRV